MCRVKPPFSLLLVLVFLGIGVTPPVFGQTGQLQATVYARMAPIVYRQLAPGLVVSALDYGSYVWVEMTPSQAAVLERSGVPFDLQPEATHIGLMGRAFDTRLGEPALAADLRAEQMPGKEGLYLVQFVGPIRKEWLTDLASSGLRPLQYVPHYAYLVWGMAQTAQTAQAAPAVRWTGPYHPAYKIDPALQKMQGTIENVAVTFYNDGERKDTVAALNALGDDVYTFAAQPDRTFYTAIVTLDASHLAEVAQIPTVWALDYVAAEPVLDDEMSAQIIAGSYADGVPFTGYGTWLGNLGYDGSGVIWSITDTGVDYDHPDLAPRIVGGHNYAGCETANPGDDPPSGGHGTHVAGIVSGDASGGFVDGNGFYYGLGMAPGSGILAQNPICGTQAAWPPAGGWQELSKQGILGGAIGANNSWTTGEGTAHGYQSSERTHDFMVRDGNFDTPDVAEPYIIVFSAGNSGPWPQSLTAPKEAKNVIVTAATQNYRASGDIDAMYSLSSRGPAVDGRYVPTIAAPGEEIASTRNDLGGSCSDAIPGTGDLYAYCTGTSMAAPHASGSVILIADWWREANSGADPSPAMAKALLINGAVDIGGAPSIPNFEEGWGRINLANVLDNGQAMVYHDQEHLFTTSGQTWTLSGGAVDPAQPLKVTLVWSDAPGAIGANPALVNDLDLEVSVGGNTYLGNVFAGGWSAMGGAADHLNNMENVYVPNPGTSQIAVRIMAGNIAGDGVPANGLGLDQDFALVVQNLGLEPDFAISATPKSYTICAPDVVTYSVPVEALFGYSQQVSLSLGGAPASTPWTFAPSLLTPPLTSTLTVTATAATPAGTHSLVISGTAGVVGTHTAEVALSVDHAAPLAPTLISPSDAATGVSLLPTFLWSLVTGANSSRIQVSDDTLFLSPLIDVSNLTTNTYTLDASLGEGTCHFWRVDGSNGCGEGEWSQVFGFETERLRRTFWDDMESGDGMWSHAAGQGSDGWILTTSDWRSPDHAWFSPDVSTVNDDFLWTTSAFSVMTDAELSFWQQYDLESGSATGYDGAVIEISTDAGLSWQDLGSHITHNPYNSIISTGYGSPIAGRQAWSGDSGGWKEVKVDLSSYAGQQAQVRWRLACDSSLNREGWYVDDVQVIATLPSNDFRNGACLSVDTTSPFTATVGGVYNYTWDFGGPGSGAYQDTATPVYTYTVPGDYVVEMGLENACVAETVSHTVSVCGQHVQATGMDVSADPRSQEVVTFTASVAGEEPIVYAWEFADGATDDGVTTTHTFPIGGVHPVTLTVSNCDGCGADQMTQVVSVCDSVVGVAVDASPTIALLNDEVTFTAKADGDPPWTYTWDFGDGSLPVASAGITATHTYTQTGEYTATLVVTNCVDAVAGAERPISVVRNKSYLPLVFKP